MGLESTTGSGPAAQEWREKAAVLDEWNLDGFIITGTALDGTHIKAAVGTISEQSGKTLPGQYLPGGDMQAVIEMSDDTRNALSRIAKEVMATGKPGVWIDPGAGMRFEIRPTGWEDANGIHGYLRRFSDATVQTAKVGAHEEVSKDHREVEIR